MMKIAFCNEVFGSWPLEKQFDFTAQCGYDGVELAPFTLDEAWQQGKEPYADIRRISSAKREQIAKFAQKAGIQVSGLHWLLSKTTGYYLTSPYPETRKRTAEYFKELIHLCSDLGGDYLVLGSPQQRNILPNFSYNDGLKYAADVLGETVDLLEKNHILLALEPLARDEANFLSSADQALELIEFMGKPAPITIHLDCKAMARGEDRPITEIILDPRFVPYEKTFHANDPNLQGPGFGKLDFAPIIAALKKNGFDGWIGVEPFDYSVGIERLAEESCAYLKKFL